MRTRRTITLSVLGAIVLGGVFAFGSTTSISQQISNIPSEIQALSDGLSGKPATIFDPPKYSIDEADSLWVVVNKQRPLAISRYRPAKLTAPAFDKPKLQNPFGLTLRKEASDALVLMAKDFREAGLGRLVLNSGFRSFKNQAALYERTKKTKGLAVAEKLSARPGFSEHQTGLAADLAATGQGCVIMVCFGKTEAGIWLKENSYRYGFILRYPPKSKAITGYQYEPWHFRFVGVELATEMKTKNIIILENFWELDPAPDYLTPAN